MRLPKHGHTRVKMPLNEAGPATVFKTLVNVPYYLGGQNITGRPITADEMTAAAFKTLSIQLTQIAVYVSITDKLCNLYNANAGKDVLSDPAKYNYANKPFNTGTGIPDNVKLPIARLLYAFAMMWNAYSTDRNAIQTIQTNLPKMLNNIDVAYAYTPQFPKDTTAADILKDINAAASNLQIDTDAVIARYNDIMNLAMQNGQWKENPLTTLFAYAQWAKSIRNDIARELGIAGNRVFGQNSSESQENTESSQTENPNAPEGAKINNGSQAKGKLRPGKPNWMKVSQDETSVWWEGYDGDLVHFTVQFTDDWQQQYKGIIFRGDAEPGEGYLLIIRMDGKDRKGRDLYATFVFDTDKDLNVRRFPRDYIGAIETIIKEAVSKSIFAITDEYDFVRSWKQ